MVETRAEELMAHSDGILDMDEISGVHDMRVATRRLRAALEVFAPCFPRAGHKRVLKEVKTIADALGERRDRDVAIRSLTGFAAQMPAPDRPGITPCWTALEEAAEAELEAARRRRETAERAAELRAELGRAEQLRREAAKRGRIAAEALAEAERERRA